MPRRPAADRARSALSERAEPVRRLVPLDRDARDVAGTAARGDILAEQVDQSADGGLWTLRVDLDPPVGQVAGVSDQPELERPGAGPPPESHALDPATHEDDRSHHGLSLGSGPPRGAPAWTLHVARRRGRSSV